jgi:nitrate/TMAO reductase-like tetraheme cytochrome c subunit
MSNWITVLGSVFVMVSMVFILAGTLSEMIDQGKNPYQSLITFTVLPEILLAGIILIVAGIIRSRIPRHLNRLKSVFQSGIRVLMSNWITVLGSVFVMVSMVFILAGTLSEMIDQGKNPYQGLITFTVLPAILLAGIILIVAGIIRSRREVIERPGLIIDFSIPRHRNLIIFFVVTSTLSFIVLSVGSFKAYEYTESVPFCGTICHSVMTPEYTAYQAGSHARVPCAQCHIGPGAPWWVRSKLSGLRQLVSVFTGEYSRPISTPIANLRPARDTCEQCHWPEVFHGKKLISYERIGAEGSVTDPIVSAVILHIGGYNKRTQRNVGIHWHISADNRVEYLIANDKRTKIKRVRVIRSDGTRKEWENSKAPEPPAGTAYRVMDCIDCHNRPAHRFKDPGDGLDELLLSGQIDTSIPGIRKLVYGAITADYKTQDEAELAIRNAMHDLYEREASDRKDIYPEQSIATAVKLYRSNVFPEMGIRWNTYVNHLGHIKSKGCFRCHNDNMTTKDGTELSSDCDLCHDVLADEEAASTLDPKIMEMITESHH